MRPNPAVRRRGVVLAALLVAVSGTRIDVLNDGSVPIADLIKLAQGLTPVQTEVGRE
jgi:hypothetical protein